MICCCIKLPPLTFKEQGLENCCRTHIASDASPSTKAQVNVAMLLEVEYTFMTSVIFGGNEVLNSKNDVREMMASIRDGLDFGVFFGYEVCVAIGRRSL